MRKGILYKDLAGQRFGKLTAIEDIGRSKHGKTLWKARCDCGNEIKVTGGSMSSGNTRSCGCLKRQMTIDRNFKHGLSKSAEYIAWCSMISRCKYPSATGYENYGARGIIVCDRWLHSFELFYSDLGPRPSSSHSLDRYPNVEGNYEPGNCRWASAAQQTRNRRKTIMVTVGDRTKPLAEWCEVQNISYQIVHERLFKLKWPPSEALGFSEHPSRRGQP